MTADLFDYILVTALVVLAWQMLRVKDLFTGIVIYMVFGIMMALAWVRLHAPDIALVEAAVGSGIISALFLGVLGRVEEKIKVVPNSEKTSPCPENKMKILITGLCILLGMILTASALTLPIHSAGLGGWVENKMSQSGVSNPVTAVVLNFRAYDTLLEIGVLALAVLASAALIRFKIRPVPVAERLLNTFVHTVVPFMILIAGYLLWAGSDKPGGAFQAGAVLSGAGVLVLLAGKSIHLDMRKVWFRILITAGFFTFLIVGIVVMGNNRNYLEYPPESAKFLILFIETIAAVSIAVIFIYSFKVCSGFLMGSSADLKEDDPS